jgi:FMN reductase
MPNIVISSSLNPKSRSRLLALIAFNELKNMGTSVEWLDLADYSIPLCDGDETYNNTKVKELKYKIQNAKGVLFAVPIYNYDVNAAAKNLIELTGEAWSNKIVGFLCAAGGKRSYMSVMSLANSLMLDFRCLIIPRFVYTVSEDFKEDDITDPKVKTQVKELAKELDRICMVLNKQSKS